MDANGFGRKLRDWRMARNLTLDEAVSELGKCSLGRPPLQLSDWRLEFLELGLTPLPEEKAILEEILVGEVFRLPARNGPVARSMA